MSRDNNNDNKNNNNISIALLSYVQEALQSALQSVSRACRPAHPIALGAIGKSSRSWTFFTHQMATISYLYFCKT